MEQAATIGELRRGLVSGLRRRDSPEKWERGRVTEQLEEIMEWRDGCEAVIGERKRRYERRDVAVSSGREGWEEQNRRAMDERGSKNGK